MNSLREYSLRIINSIKRRMWSLHPKSFLYDHRCKKYPDIPISVIIDRDLQARIWPCDVLGKQLYIQGQMEKNETRFIKRNLKRGMVFFDVGANMGYYSIIGAKLVGNKGQVHSFEPSARMFQELKYNISINKFNNIRTNNFALGEKKGTAMLSRYTLGKEVYGSLSQRTFPGAEIIGYDEIQVKTFDDYVDEQNIASIDLIKMDVEGAELNVIKGALNTIKCKHPIIILEIVQTNLIGFGAQATDIYNIFSDNSYYIARVSSPQLRLTQNDFMEAIRNEYNFVAMHQKAKK